MRQPVLCTGFTAVRALKGVPAAIAISQLNGAAKSSGAVAVKKGLGEDQAEAVDADGAVKL